MPARRNSAPRPSGNGDENHYAGDRVRNTAQRVRAREGAAPTNFSTPNGGHGSAQANNRSNNGGRQQVNGQGQKRSRSSSRPQHNQQDHPRNPAPPRDQAQGGGRSHPSSRIPRLQQSHSPAPVTPRDQAHGPGRSRSRRPSQVDVPHQPQHQPQPRGGSRPPSRSRPRSRQPSQNGTQHQPQQNNGGPQYDNGASQSQGSNNKRRRRSSSSLPSPPLGPRGRGTVHFDQKIFKGLGNNEMAWTWTAEGGSSSRPMPPSFDNSMNNAPSQPSDGLRGRSNSRGNSGGSPLQTCQFWRENRCTYGDGCRYAHYEIPPQDGQSGSSQSDRSQSRTPPGHCRYGAKCTHQNCKYKHPGRDQQDGQSVPSLPSLGGNSEPWKKSKTCMWDSTPRGCMKRATCQFRHRDDPALDQTFNTQFDAGNAGFEGNVGGRRGRNGAQPPSDLSPMQGRVLQCSRQRPGDERALVMDKAHRTYQRDFEMMDAGQVKPTSDLKIDHLTINGGRQRVLPSGTILAALISSGDITRAFPGGQYELERVSEYDNESALFAAIKSIEMQHPDIYPPPTIGELRELAQSPSYQALVTGIELASSVLPGSRGATQSISSPASYVSTSSLTPDKVCALLNLWGRPVGVSFCLSTFLYDYPGDINIVEAKEEHVDDMRTVWIHNDCGTGGGAFDRGRAKDRWYGMSSVSNNHRMDIDRALKLQNKWGYKHHDMPGLTVEDRERLYQMRDAPRYEDIEPTPMELDDETYKSQLPKVQTQSSNGQSKPESNGHSEPEANAQSQPESSGHSQPESNGQFQPESNGQAQPESNGQAQPESNGQSQSETNGQSEQVDDDSSWYGCSDSEDRRPALRSILKNSTTRQARAGASGASSPATQTQPLRSESAGETTLQQTENGNSQSMLSFTPSIAPRPLSMPSLLAAPAAPAPASSLLLSQLVGTASANLFKGSLLSTPVAPLTEAAAPPVPATSGTAPQMPTPVSAKRSAGEANLDEGNGTTAPSSAKKHQQYPPALLSVSRPVPAMSSTVPHMPTPVSAKRSAGAANLDDDDGITLVPSAKKYQQHHPTLLSISRRDRNNPKENIFSIASPAPELPEPPVSPVLPLWPRQKLRPHSRPQHSRPRTANTSAPLQRVPAMRRSINEISDGDETQQPAPKKMRLDTVSTLQLAPARRRSIHDISDGDEAKKPVPKKMRLDTAQPISPPAASPLQLVPARRRSIDEISDEDEAEQPGPKKRRLDYVQVVLARLHGVDPLGTGFTLSTPQTRAAVLRSSTVSVFSRDTGSAGTSSPPASPFSEAAPSLTDASTISASSPRQLASPSPSVPESEVHPFDVDTIDQPGPGAFDYYEPEPRIPVSTVSKDPSSTSTKVWGWVKSVAQCL